MLSPETYKELTTEYRTIRAIISDLDLTKEEVLEQIEKKLPLGLRIEHYLDELNDGAEFKSTVDDFLQVVFG